MYHNCKGALSASSSDTDSMEEALTIEHLFSTLDEAICNEYFKIIEMSPDITFVETSTSHANASKNRFVRLILHLTTRYGDVLPIKDTAVKLTPLPGLPESYYINANFIRDTTRANKKKHNKKQVYIASQAPLLHTLSDFWRMVWEYRVPVIVMITNLVEKNRIKADMYWPQKPGDLCIYGDTRVKLVSEKHRANDLVIRKFLICQPRKYYEYTSSDATISSISLSWTDSHSEEGNLDTEPIYIFNDEEDSGTASNSHCHFSWSNTTNAHPGNNKSSSNTSNTSHSTTSTTNNSLNSSFRKKKRRESYDSSSPVYGTPPSSGTPYSYGSMTPPYDNAGMCTPPYYAGTPPPLSDSGSVLSVSFGSCLSSTDPLEQTNKLQDDSIDGDVSKDTNEFSGLFKNTQQSTETSDDSKNPKPPENGNLEKRQTPEARKEIEPTRDTSQEANTRRDNDLRSSGSREEIPKSEKSNQGQDKKSKDSIECMCGANVDCGGTICGHFEVRTCYQLHCTTWPDFGVPNSSRIMQDIIEEVDLRKRGVDDPILVHCSAGIGRTGTFLAVHTNLDRELKGETIDIKETVARLRRQRIGMVQSADQYMFIYRVLCDVLKERGQSWHPALRDVYDLMVADRKAKKTKTKNLDSPDPRQKREIISELLSSTNLLARKGKQTRRRSWSYSWGGRPAERAQIPTSKKLRRRSECRTRPKQTNKKPVMKLTPPTNRITNPTLSPTIPKTVNVCSTPSEPVLLPARSKSEVKQSKMKNKTVSTEPTTNKT